ncbi:unnamed protein product [Blepharisma stoltei]|uniref:Uncharacterized protein n=1 Tax=Blepharisma stoltei TaxID=1481888 RepID=A0AAU9JT77_9CILI|nr:unnamed protein product [Blepharisma stoltei]
MKQIYRLCFSCFEKAKKEQEKEIEVINPTEKGNIDISTKKFNVKIVKDDASNSSSNHSNLAISSLEISSVSKQTGSEGKRASELINANAIAFTPDGYKRKKYVKHNNRKLSEDSKSGIS